MITNSSQLLGQTLGTCTRERLLGQGVMGAVYLTQHPGRDCAASAWLKPSEPELRSLVEEDS